MRTVIITKVYEIRESAKGWSDTYCMYFNKEKAQQCAKELEEEYNKAGFKHHFRVYEHTCTDAIVYVTEE